MTEKKHGGPRPNSGRPRLPDDQKVVTKSLAIRLSGQDLEDLEGLQEEGETTNAAAKRLLLWAIEEIKRS